MFLVNKRKAHTYYLSIAEALFEKLDYEVVELVMEMAMDRYAAKVSKAVFASLSKKCKLEVLQNWGEWLEQLIIGHR